jgi:hypothetical protein
MAALGAGGDSVGRDEGAVQAQEGQCAAAGVGQHVGQVGRPPGDHVERLVQIAVGGGNAQPGLAGQGARVQAVAQTAQHEQDLGVHVAGPLGRAAPGRRRWRAIQPVTDFNTGADTSRLARWATAGSRGRGDRPLARRSSPREPAPSS